MQHPEIQTQTPLPPAAAAQNAGSFGFALVLTMIEQNKVTHTARTFLTSSLAEEASMSWNRVGPASWQTNDAGWFEAEARIGTELAEYMDELPFPDKVATALPGLGRAIAERPCPAIAEPNAAAGEFLLEVGVLPDGQKIAYLSAKGARSGFRIAGPKSWGGVRNLATLDFSEADLLAFINTCAPGLRAKLIEGGAK